MKAIACHGPLLPGMELSLSVPLFKKVHISSKM